MWAEAVVLIGVLVFAVVGTRLIIDYALRHGLLDVPNARSSHEKPTPRGGGVAIVISTCSGWGVLACLGHMDRPLLFALVGGGGVVALVGYCDDRWSLSPLLRLIAHIAAAVWALCCLGGLPPLRLGGEVVDLGWMGNILGGLAIVWTVNLFNFMDGIDGLAASEALFISTGAAVIFAMAGLNGVAVPLALAAACLGFLFWNWSPARIFLGDVGSGYLGYCIAVIGIAFTSAEPAAAWEFLILGGLFFVDATVTLLRRLMRSEPIYQAHRTHAYQWLARRWGNHARVSWAAAFVNVLWLWPFAFVAQRIPETAWLLVIVSLVPLVVTVFICGAGSPADPAAQKLRG